MKIDFEIATENNIPGIIKMMAEFNGIDSYPFDQVKSKSNLSHFIADQNLGRAWTINIGNLAIGYIILTFGFSFEHNGRDAFIDELFLKPEYRQKGVGRTAMEFVEKEAFTLGVNVMHLEVEQHNESGSKLYRENGYESNGRILLSKKIIDNNERKTTTHNN